MPQDIEITDEMIEAGRKALAESGYFNEITSAETFLVIAILNAAFEAAGVPLTTDPEAAYLKRHNSSGGH